MNGKTDVIPNAVRATGTPLLIKTAYIFSTAVAMLGWLWALGWVAFASAKWLI